MLSDWDNHFAGNTFVAQQAVTNLKALVRQRSRWFQGHVTCWIHIPGILKSDLRLSTRIDTVYYLLGITMVFLFFPATFLFLLGAFFVRLSALISLLLFIMYGLCLAASQSSALPVVSVPGPKQSEPNSPRVFKPALCGGLNISLYLWFPPWIV